MRIVLWLAIAVFVSSLFWPQLLNDKSIIYCLVMFFVLLTLPRLRILAVIPLSAVYFTFYAHLTLTGSLPISQLNIALPFSNSTSLQALVDGQDHNIIVQVNSLISNKNKGYFTAKLIELDGHHLNYSPQLEMRWYKPTLDVQAGERHRFIVRFKPVYGPRGLYQPDSMVKNGVFLSISLIRQELKRICHCNQANFLFALIYIRKLKRYQIL